MSSSWKNPFMLKEKPAFENEGIDNDKEDIPKHFDVFNNIIDGKKLKQNYPKDLRYSNK